MSSTCVAGVNDPATLAGRPKGSSWNEPTLKVYDLITKTRRRRRPEESGDDYSIAGFVGNFVGGVDDRRGRGRSVAPPA
jgi:hypothetical protein